MSCTAVMMHSSILCYYSMVRICTYSLQMKKTEGITSHQLYSLAMAREPLSHLFKARDLFQMYITDMGMKTMTERLWFIRLNQKKLHAEDYTHLRDSINSDGREARGQERDGAAQEEGHGQLVILPSTFVGSPCYLHMRTMDAMTYVRAYGRGRPSLFITMTCNPMWEEITPHLLPHQRPYDRQDVIARVFNQKTRALWTMLVKGELYGTVAAIMYTIEWQKLGLPHVHLLLWLIDKIQSSDIDYYFCRIA